MMTYYDHIEHIGTIYITNISFQLPLVEYFISPIAQRHSLLSVTNSIPTIYTISNIQLHTLLEYISTINTPSS